MGMLTEDRMRERKRWASEMREGTRLRQASSQAERLRLGPVTIGGNLAATATLESAWPHTLFRLFFFSPSGLYAGLLFCSANRIDFREETPA